MNAHEIAVGEGAELLDRHHPGWELKIDSSNLLMNSEWDCILGQLYGSYSRGMRTLERDHRLLGRDLPDPYALGFDLIYGSDRELDELAYTWTAEIDERKEARA